MLASFFILLFEGSCLHGDMLLMLTLLCVMLYVMCFSHRAFNYGALASYLFLSCCYLLVCLLINAKVVDLLPLCPYPLGLALFGFNTMKFEYRH